MLLSLSHGWECIHAESVVLLWEHIEDTDAALGSPSSHAKPPLPTLGSVCADIRCWDGVMQAHTCLLCLPQACPATLFSLAFATKVARYVVSGWLVTGVLKDCKMKFKIQNWASCNSSLPICKCIKWWHKRRQRILITWVAEHIWNCTWKNLGPELDGIMMCFNCGALTRTRQQNNKCSGKCPAMTCQMLKMTRNKKSAYIFPDVGRCPICHIKTGYLCIYPCHTYSSCLFFGLFF